MNFTKLTSHEGNANAFTRTRRRKRCNEQNWISLNARIFYMNFAL